MISRVKRARFGIENVGQPETVTITETFQMRSVTVHCPVAGLARALGTSSLVSRAPGITMRRTLAKNWFTHEKNSSAGALHVLVHFLDVLSTTTT